MTYDKFMIERMFQLTGCQIVSLMRKYKITIRQLSDRMQITMKRIRQIRNLGKVVALKGYGVFDWYQAITGELTPRMNHVLLRRA